MPTLPDILKPSRERFGADPLGYSAQALEHWRMVQALAGFPVSPEEPIGSEHLKSPILWLSHAMALTDAATIVIRADPDFGPLLDEIKGIRDSQFRAVGLMLVGYSLEVCLKAMLIIRKTPGGYLADEARHRHHRLEQLSDFMPDLGPKDKAILRGLTYFVTWAGRYPDPGTGRESERENIFKISETHEISAADLFGLASRVQIYVGHIIAGSKPSKR